MSISQALKIAEANAHYEKWPFGCVIKKGGAVKAVGWNILKCDPTFLDDHSNCSVHAEEHALRQITNAHNCVIFVARVTKSGEPALAKPCLRCQELIRRSGVKRVVFTTDTDGVVGEWRP